MSSSKSTARILGVLFLTTFILNIISGEIIEPILNAPNYLAQLYPNKVQINIAVLFELLSAIAVIGIVTILFPVLKKHNKNIALGYLGIRVIESVFIIISGISPFPLEILSRDFLQASGTDTSHFLALGNLAVAWRYWTFEMVKILYFIAALMFFYSSYQSKLVPRFLSVWGLIGAPLALTASLLVILGYDTGMVLYFPGGLTEPFLGVWLIVKGFNPAAVTSESGKTD